MGVILTCVVLAALLIIGVDLARRIADRRKAATDPKLVLQRAVDNGMQQVGEAMKCLEVLKERVASLQRDDAQYVAEKCRLEYRIKYALDSHDEAEAKKAAIELAVVERNLATTRSQLELILGAYAELSVQVDAGKEKIATAKRWAERLDIQLTASEHQAQMANLADGLQDTGVSEAQVKIQEQIARNQAQAVRDASFERDAEAEEILSRYRNQT